MKEAVLFYFSKRGGETAEKIAHCLKKEYHCSLYAPAKHVRDGHQVIAGGIGAFTGTVFDRADALIYVGSCGIAVRSIAPYLKSKTTDPAVICVDECAKFCIALLSGHIGGGNRLTNLIAEEIGAAAVVTTATDINRRFSVDTWATENGFVIGSMAAAKEVSAAVLEHDVPICADVQIKGALPAGLYAGESGKVGILVSVCKKAPFEKTLALIPRVLTIGIGCRRGTACEVIEEAVNRVFEEHGLDLRAVRDAASIDLKTNETGLLSFCEKRSLPITFYTAKQLLEVPGTFSASGFVKSVTGVENVCERSAAAKGGRIIVNKSAQNGVTVAVALSDWEVNFG